MNPLSLIRRMIGASAGAAGRSGYVPTPPAGQQDRVLFADGSWRNLGTLTFKGVVAAASLPASSSVAGDYYVIGTAGTIYSITFAVGDQAIWNGSVWQKVTLGTTQIGQGGTGGTTAAEARTNLYVFSKDEIYNHIRAVRGGLAFDGASSGHYVQSRIASLGGSDFSWRLTFLCPTSSTGSPYVAVLMSALNAASGYSFVFYLSGTSLIAQIWGASAIDFRQHAILNFLTTFGGAIVEVVAVRTAGASSLTLYVNGQSVSTLESSGGTPPAWSGNVNSVSHTIGNYRNSGTNPFFGAVFGATLFNRALSAPEVLKLANQGVSEWDKWGSLTPSYSSDFSAGVNGWTGIGATLNGNIDSIGSVDDTLRLTSDASTGNHQGYVSAGFAYGKMYRLSYDYYMPVTANTNAKQFRVYTGGGNQLIDIITSPADATWTSRSLEFIYASSNPIFQVLMATSGGSNSFTGNLGDLLYLKNVRIVEIGAILDVDANVGVGYQAPDRSANNSHGDIATGGVSHIMEKYDGLHTIVKTFNHSDISSTAATSILCTLPKNCGIVEVEFDRTTAFDSGTTADIGITGTAAKFVSAQSLVGTTIAWVDSLSKASESNSANTSIWIKKSGATTVGAVTVRITYRIRNK